MASQRSRVDSLRERASRPQRGLDRCIPVAVWMLLVGCLAGATTRAEGEYPADITPPPGTRYPCALTPLPHGLPGIPEADRHYINRTYTVILRATQAKLVVLKAIEEGGPLQDALSSYEDTMRTLEGRLRSEVPPEGLRPFQDDVVAALGLQRAFFTAAVPLRRRGGSMGDVYKIPQGRQASQRLLSAWARMQSRYAAWSKETADSIYHHLCALDLF